MGKVRLALGTAPEVPWSVLSGFHITWLFDPLFPIGPAGSRGPGTDESSK